MLRQSVLLFLAFACSQTLSSPLALGQDTAPDVSVDQPAVVSLTDEPAAPQVATEPVAASLPPSAEPVTRWELFKEQLAASGIQYKGDATNYYQGVASGGREQRFGYGLHTDHVFNFDLGTIAGMQGTFFKVRFEGQFGEFINGSTGAVLASNTSGLLPEPGVDQIAVTNLLLTQMVSDRAGVYFGKLDTMDGDLNAYAHGRGKTQFMNTGFVATPIAFRTTPYSTWGAGFVVLGDEGTPTFNVAVIDPRSFATTFDLNEIYADGVTITGEMRQATNFLGQKGHQLVGGIWSSRDTVLLADAPLLLLPNAGPAQGDQSWALYWNFDQQLVPSYTNPERGWGVFGRAAIADPDTNPIDYFLSFGIGGDSSLRACKNDTFGIGWYYASTSDELPGRLLGDAGQGYEAFYNFEISKCVHLTTDLQVIDPALLGVDSALVTGVRLNIDF